MRPESKKFLYDIQTACKALQEFLKDKTLDDFVQAIFSDLL
jgi:uncharacterized protein with HEPN domain